MQIKNKTLISALAFSALSIAATASADLVVYEPFNYDTGNINGTAATGTGLTGNWSSNRTGVDSGNLTFGGLETTTGSTNSGAFTTFSRAGGGAGTTLATGPGSLSGSGLLADGATLWFSALIDVNPDSVAFMGIGTARPDGFGRWGDNGSGDEGLGFRIDKSGTGARIYAYSWYDNGGDGGTLVTLADGTHLVVGKITWTASGETVDLYLPGAGDVSTSGSIVSSTTTDRNIDQTGASDVDDLFNTFGYAGQRMGAGTELDPYVSSYLLDEVRYGASYEDVVPVPEPGSLALLGLGSLLVAGRRRRA